MTQPVDLYGRIEALQDRLTRLSEASLRINDSLDLDAVLQRVLDTARSLTGARYGVMTTSDESGAMEELLTSGLTPREAMQLWEISGGADFFKYLESIPGPLRIPDLADHARSLGLLDFHTPTPLTSFLTVPILHRGHRMGNIHMGKAIPGQEFSHEDEETLVMFASQSAMVIANARRYREEQRARTALETLVETSPVGVVVFDARTGLPTSMNREATRIMSSLIDSDRPPESLLEVATIRRADGREISLREWPLAEALSTGETLRAEEIVIKVPDGRSLATVLNGAPTFSEDGEIQSFVVTLQDMSFLEETERLRAEFLGMVSHELRTPLTSIKGSVATMLEAAADLDLGELRQFLRIIMDQADNMRELIDDLLDVARIETGTLPVNPEPAEVAPLVDRARSSFLSGGGRNNLSIEIAPDLPLIMADKRRVVQVLGNLLSNASRHSPESSTIRVVVAREGVHVVFSVIDQGWGIPAERLPRLFRKFAPAESKDQSGDTGLGLAICKGIVETHGGRIWAESEGPSLGARFTFTIPAVEAVGIDRPAAAGRPRRRRGKSAPVLVVDDDPQTLRYVRRTLAAEDYDPIVTGDPEEVLRLVRESRPRLVLLDMMLPGYDGIELMMDIFSVAEVPVIFLSGYGQQEIIAKAFDAGASDYIVKPFTPTELVARVKAALRKRGAAYSTEPAEPYTLGDLTIDYDARMVTVAGAPVKLTAKEYGLLRTLSMNAGRVLTHDQLLRRVWGSNKIGNKQTLRTHLRRLREKVGDDAHNPIYIFTESRVGYRMAKGETKVEEAVP